MLVGAGALQFALEQGFAYEELLTPESKTAWEAWKKEAKYQPKANSEVGDETTSILLEAERHVGSDQVHLARQRGAPDGDTPRTWLQHAHQHPTHQVDQHDDQPGEELAGHVLRRRRRCCDSRRRDLREVVAEKYAPAALR